MKLLTLIVLLTSSQLAHSLSQNEKVCLALNVYHEARSSSKDWLKVATVAVNRSRAFKDYKFGAKSSNICDIVRSRQYTTASKLKQRRLEVEVYSLIKEIIEKTTNFNHTQALYFSSRKGRLYYK